MFHQIEFSVLILHCDAVKAKRVSQERDHRPFWSNQTSPVGFTHSGLKFLAPRLTIAEGSVQNSQQKLRQNPPQILETKPHKKTGKERVMQPPKGKFCHP